MADRGCKSPATSRRIVPIDSYRPTRSWTSGSPDRRTDGTDDAGVFFRATDPGRWKEADKVNSAAKPLGLHPVYPRTDRRARRSTRHGVDKSARRRAACARVSRQRASPSAESAPGRAHRTTPDEWSQADTGPVKLVELMTDRPQNASRQEVRSTFNAC